ncbi:hypothetical protein OUY22_31675 [Nonomuraea sp. MCN248]|uniref:DUF5709 domain-containing protein n=1 Tax=Nonomuraea corallina TaxID=2989783 RepID=A0ABT4SL75_9ACTN|nr:hypothetical protein [Nonomuraea corallina]MDA0637992.1 hypothetical protein [Nonomuraea corallina]
MSEMDVRGDDDNFADDAELPIETPAADAAEQQRLLRDEEEQVRRELPLEVNPADAVEQDRVVEYDDDDYR